VEAQGFSGNQRDVINFASPFRFNPGPLLQLPRSDSGGSVLGEWKHVFSDRSSVTVQSYYDRYDLSEAAERLSIGTVDVEAQHHYQVSPQQELVWGGGYRRTDNKSAPGLQLYFNPPHLTTQLVSGFVQDEYLLAGGRLHLIGGARVEEDNYAGMNIQPTARLLWEPNRRYSWWAAVSRAVRTPSLIERDLMTNFLVTDLGHVFWAECHGNPDFRSETLLSYEVGQRVQLRNRLSLDASIFYNLYHDLRTANLSNFYFDQQRGVVVFPVYYVNGLSAHTYGTEIDLTYSATKNWNLTGGYTWLRLIPSDYNHRLGLTETNGPTDRQHEAQLHSEFDLSRTMQLDTSLYYMGSIPAVGIPGHWRADLRWGWRITPKVDLSVTGQDLLSASHPEYVFDVLGRSLQVTSVVSKN
jgi:iron complex outermembrane receptor protein